MAASQKPSLYAVFGAPVLHSLSPKMHNAGFEALQLNSIYFRAGAKSAAEVVKLARDLGLKGFNVTSPFKEEIVNFLSEKRPEVELLGAANTVIVKGDSLIGHNTDGIGAIGALREAGVEPGGREAVVLGAGGAAKAAILALRDGGARVKVLNRSPGPLEEIAEKFRVETYSATPENFECFVPAADILISCVSTADRLVSPELLHSELAVLDAHYVSESALVKDARQRGCALIDGRKWLLHQGLGAFKLFTKKDPPVEIMERALCVSQDNQALNLALIGFMGSGKSSVGKELSKLMKWPHVDVDQQVEARCGRSIRELFAEEGEQRFRELESEILTELGHMHKTIVSCGGGVVTGGGNRTLLKTRFRSIWLWASLEDLEKRLGQDETRPLLKGADRPKKISTLLSQRIPWYADCAELAVDGTGDVKDIAEKIYAEIRRTE